MIPTDLIKIEISFLFQVNDGYLVHFFVPEKDTPSIPKHVTFVLDVSGSMKGYGEEIGKITQLQDAMIGILEQLDQEDYCRSCH